MLLCRVAKGKVFRTEVNMDHLQGAAPDGYHSVLGIATKDGPLNYDEYVVYNPAAIQPWLKCVYEFEKLDVPDPMTTLLDHSGIPATNATATPIFKNFVFENDQDNQVYMQFGKKYSNAFTLDFRYPMTPYNAFTFAMSFFEL